MTDHTWKQLPLWSEKVLAELEVDPHVLQQTGLPDGTCEGDDQTQQKGQSAYIQLPLLDCQLEVETVSADFK